MISAVALASSLFWSAITTEAQAKALKLQATAWEHQATVDVFAHLTESARRFEDARTSADESLMQFELAAMLFATDTYIAHLDSGSIDVPAVRRLTDGVLRVLATGVPCEGQPEAVSEIWERDKFFSAAARASELDLKTCGQ